MPSGNIEVPALSASPLVPAEARQLRDTFEALVNSLVSIVREDKPGDLGAYAFRAHGGRIFLVLPLKSATALPAINAAAPAQLDIEQTLTVSATPTQAEVQAIRDFARAIGRHLAALEKIGQQNRFPG
jgi:hypothetical protein